MIDHTHNPESRSWLESANSADCDFPIQNLPFSVFRRSASQEPWRGGVAIGDCVLDLKALARTASLPGLAQQALNAAAEPKLNEFMRMGRPAWRALRHALHALLEAGAATPAWAQECLVPMAGAEYDIPARIGDYTDFYTSIHHASTISKLFDPEADVPPNFRWVPTAYHGRVSSIGLSGQRYRRPNGQRVLPGERQPSYGPCTRLDYELELGVYIGPGNTLGERISIADADDQIFGLCLLNDWSARDIQVWEMNPLGPFHAKNFATTISPWIVTSEALAPFRKPWTRPPADPQPLDYLAAPSNADRGAFDIRLKVSIQSGQMRKSGLPVSELSRTSFIHHYWSIAQMITHHAAGGCNLQPGDLLGTGTISGPTIDQAGAMMELALAGQKPVRLPSGEERSFLQDGDSIEFTGWCEGEGLARIGFGANSGLVLPALRCADPARPAAIPISAIQGDAMDAPSEAGIRLIASNPRFLALTRSRARVRWGLSALTAALFYGFVLMIGAGAGIFAAKVGDGLMPLGFYLAIGMILFVVAVTAIYARLGVRLYGQMNDELRRELGL